jgi:hypothetical protein
MSDAKIRTKDIRIDNSKRWQHQHWISLVSAYKNSPFFDHYEERFAPLYTARLFDFLTDLNLELLNVLTGILGIDDRVKISENYVVALPGDEDLRGKKALRRGCDLTEARSCGNSDRSAEANGNNYNAVTLPYTQVFSDRMEFVSGLSVIDLVMCEGAGAQCLF